MRSRTTSLFASSLLSLLVAAQAACGSAPEVTEPEVADDGSRAAVLDPARRFSDALRLPEGAAPRAYRLALRIDPASDTFSGEVVIEVELAQPTHLLRLHADGLAIGRAVARAAGRTIDLETDQKGTQLVVLSKDAPLPAGLVEVELAWTGSLGEAPVGLYRAEDSGHWLASTQFEPLEARRAFPCFDEPRFKTPFTLTIDAPAGLRAVSNNPERLAAEAPEPGWARWEFAPTPPLPTYLVAFAVGALDVVEGERISQGRVPFRVLTVAGKGHLASFALERIPRHLDWQERWFGSPYPFAKLDFIAVPSFSSTAMENPGLVTFREAALLIDGDNAAIEDRLRCEAVVAHELAHMWFGDLVTPAWWDDIWLNEAFATWMGRKSVAAVSPELGVSDLVLRTKYVVMHDDARAHARAVRQPIASDGDIYNAFDRITYVKGAAVLSMIEAWIGPERFQAGVRSYLEAFAHGTATTADLMSHLGVSGQRDVASLVESFVDKPGVPLVTLDWRCEPDGAVAIDVAQRAYRVLGDTRPDDGATWRVPVCARLSDGKTSREHCDVLDAPKATWRAELGFCPTFAHPNFDESGYYRWQTRLGPISVARQDEAAFAGYVASLTGGIETGSAPLAALTDGIEPLFEASLSPAQLEDLVGGLVQVSRLDPEAPRSARFHKRVRALLDRVPLDLGLGDSPRERQMMPTLVRARYWLARDPRVAARAAKVGKAFLAALEGAARPRTPITAEQITVYLPLYAYSLGDAPSGQKQRDALWQRLRAALDKVDKPSERDVVIETLASFDDPALAVKTLGLLLDGTLRAQDGRTVRRNLSPRREVALAAWRWLEDNFEAVLALVGSKGAPALPYFAEPLCQEGDADMVAAFFASKREALPDSVDRPVAQVLEEIGACVAARARYLDEVRAWYR